MTEREQFEAWALGPGGYTKEELRIFSGQYVDEHANTALDAWQASRRAALSEEWLTKANELYDQCKLWPERSAAGFMALLNLRNHVQALLTAARPASGETE